MSGLDLAVVRHHDVGAGRNRVAGYDFFLIVDHHDLRMEIFFVLNDHETGDTGGLVDFAFYAEAGDHVAELHCAGLFGQDREVVRIPLDEDFAFLDRAAVIRGNHRADNNAVPLEFASILVIVDPDEAVFVQHDVVAVRRGHRAELDITNRAVVLGLDDRLLEGLAGRSTDVEGTHGQLGAGLADGLSGDDANRLAEVDQFAVGQIAAVALGAAAALGFAGQNRTDAELLHTHVFKRGGRRLVDDVTGLDDHLAGDRILDRLAAGAADDAGLEVDHFLVAFVNRLDDDAFDRPAILLRDDDILCGIDQLAGQVAGIGRLQRGVGQALARAVGRDEVFEHGQALAEV